MRACRRHHRRITQGMPTMERAVHTSTAISDAGRGGGSRSGSRSAAGNGRGGTGTILYSLGSRGRRARYSRSVTTGASPHARDEGSCGMLQVDERVEIGGDHLCERAARRGSAREPEQACRDLLERRRGQQRVRDPRRRSRTRASPSRASARAARATAARAPRAGAASQRGRHGKSERTQRVDADARAVARRVVVDELVAPELVVDASRARTAAAPRRAGRESTATSRYDGRYQACPALRSAR